MVLTVQPVEPEKWPWHLTGNKGSRPRLDDIGNKRKTLGILDSILLFLFALGAIFVAMTVDWSLGSCVQTWGRQRVTNPTWINKRDSKTN